MSLPSAPAYDAWATYYDLTEGDRRPHLRFYGSLLRPEDRSVLEVACGTGLVAADLGERIAARGAEPRVVGVDISEAMLAIARERAPQGRWVHGDMRALPVEGRFDLVFCCYHSYQFMLEDADLAQAFAAARARVAPGGRFAFDLYQPNLAYLRAARTDTLARSVRHEGRELQIREDARYDEGRRILQLDWRLVAADAPGHVLAATQFRIRQYFAADIERLLGSSGWRILERYGDLDRRPFDAASKRQVLVCAPA
jgi:SAM-dependent methyltransferase